MEAYCLQGSVVNRSRYVIIIKYDKKFRENIFIEDLDMQVLCLQAVEELSAAEIIKKINKKKLFTVGAPLALKEKSKIVLGGNKCKLLRQYSRQELTYRKGSSISLWLENGVCIVNDNVIHQRDIYLYYDDKVSEGAKKVVADLVTNLPLILVEPDIEARIQQLQGCFYPENTFSYQDGTVWGAIWAHFSWLIYVVNAAWLKYLSNPADRRLLRQLRVRLRWLRSILSFFRPVFKQDSCKEWQLQLRNSGVELGSVRELDVMLLSLENLALATAEGKENSSCLQRYFTKHRQNKLNNLTKNITLGQKTLELATFVIWLQKQPLLPAYTKVNFRQIVLKRLKKWNTKLLATTSNKKVLYDMKEAHSVRIRIKKMRYVLLSLVEFGNGNGKITRQLKQLQDLLGIMHDDYTNGLFVRKLKGASKNHREEVLLFSGWESAKVESSQALLEATWGDFNEELSVWKKSLTK